MTNKGTIIISAWGCLGKTTFAANHKEICLDIESIHYSRIYQNPITNDEISKGDDNFIQNENYPSNYIKAIVDNLGKYKFIFITLARELFRELDELGLEYTIVYPNKTRKSKILNDAKKRGNNENFIQILNRILSSEEEHDFLKNNFNYKKFICLPDDEYITDFIYRNYQIEK
jgi:hypothetical protein